MNKVIIIVLGIIIGTGGVPILPVDAVYGQWSYQTLKIPVRDGKWLAGDLYCIDTTIARPTVLIQTPYNKNNFRAYIGASASQVPYDSLNYNYLVVDWRGYFGSDSADVAGYDRGLDGYDIVEWTASQSWSDGKIGTWGLSALGRIQFLTAKHRPPHLYASIPMVASYKSPIYREFYYGGDYRKELTQGKVMLGFVPESLVFAHYKYDIFWAYVEPMSDYPDSINVPMLLITGWYDHNLDEPLFALDGLRARSDLPVRDKHKILIGPWSHSELGRLEQGELEYPNAVDSARSVSFRFLDRYLRGISNGYENEPVIRYYQLGADEWKNTDDWYSLSNASDTLYFGVNGALLNSAPGSLLADSFVSDPRNPVPSIGGIRFSPFVQVVVGPRDQRDSVENRSDVLVYSPPVWASDSIVVAGVIKAKIYFSSDREDMDLSVRLCDVYPDGRSMLITEGIRRMRFRNGYTSEQLLVPGDTDSVVVELPNIAYTFLAGHKIKVIVSSSSYPIFDINLNNGDSLYKPGDTLVVTNKIFCGGAYASRVEIPTIAVGVEEDPRITNSKSQLEIFPNPFVRTAGVRGLGLGIRINIYDISGKMVEETDETVIGKGLRAGVYFIKADGYKLTKIIKL